MSITCHYCGAIAGKGSEVGHRSSCPTLRFEYKPFPKSSELTVLDIACKLEVFAQILQFRGYEKEGADLRAIALRLK